MQWIKVTDLERWADRIGGRIEFPAIVRDLVLASARDIGDIRHIRFPSGESGQVRGYDGDLTTAAGSLYVPTGRSVWEFGTNGDADDKFRSDYKTRVEGLAKDAEKAKEAKDVTFIFVTPRRYNHPTLKLPDLVKEYRDKGDFADVRYYDGAMMEAWLAEHGAVGAKHAKLVLGHVPDLGARSTDEFWSDFSKEYSPQLTETVALCARQGQADRIVSHLLGSSGSLVFVGDGPNEVSAVAVAAIRSAEKPDRDYLEARTLVVDTDEAGRMLSVADRYSYIVSPTVKDTGASLSTYGPAVSTLDYRPAGRGYERLERPSTRDMSEALRSMNFNEDEAEALARRSGRSLTILQRHAHRAGAKRPAWRTDAGRLIPALLAGTWNTRQEGDRAVLAELSGTGYDAYEDTIRPLLEMHDAPLDLKAGIWSLRAPVDAFANLAHLVSSQHLERLAAVAVKVFSADPPDIGQERFGVSSAPYSSLLRDGLATTLLIVAAMHDELGIDAIDRPDAFVRDLIAGLPGLRDDPRVMLSLDRQLTVLMEAAPDPLLSALEHQLEGDPDKAAMLFAETKVFGAARSNLPSILWALELQAWDPAYFRRVVLLLAKLASRDPGSDRSGNRPISSLRDIYVAWSPGTNASLAERLAVLDEIMELHPRVGWDLTVQLLPKLQDMKGPTQRPRFRDAGASERETLTRGMVAETYDALADRALSGLGRDPARWMAVVEALPRFSPERRAQFLQMLSTYVSAVAGEERIELRRALRALADRHRRFRDAQWAMPGEEIDELDAIVARLESTDALGQARTLFDEWMPFMSDDLVAAEKAVEQRRRAALADLAATGGAPAVLQLAATVRIPRLAAHAAAHGIRDESVLEELLNDGAPDVPAPDFASALAGNMRLVRGAAFDRGLADIASRHGWSPVRIASMLLNWPESPETWRLVDALGAEASSYFWSKREPHRFEGKATDLQTLVLKYVAAGRASTALEALHGREKDLEWSTVKTLLEGRAKEIGDARGLRSDMDGWYVSELFKDLRGRPGVDKVELAGLEYAFFPLLEHEDADLALFELMATDPEFFVSILKDVYVEDGTDPADQEITETERVRSNASHRILIAFERMPGEKTGVTDETALTSWVEGMLEEGRKARRTTVVPMYIGRVMAHASPEDGVWPPAPVAATIERLGSEDVENSIAIERFNMRGVYSKPMFEGGRQERDLAERYRDWAKARSAFPRTKAMLTGIAARWDEDARQADEEAERDRVRFDS